MTTIKFTDGQTNRQTDGRTAYDGNTALCTVCISATL